MLRNAARRTPSFTAPGRIVLSILVGGTLIHASADLSLAAPGLQTWVLDSTLGPGRPETRPEFGFDIAIDGDTAIIGQPDFFKGTAVVYQQDAVTWNSQTVLPAIGNDTSFAASIDVHGDAAIVGAWNTPSTGGGASIWRKSGGTWQLEKDLIHDTLHRGALGVDVAIYGNVAVAGAPGFNTSGAAFVFEHDGTSWNETAKLLPSSSGRAWFGQTVELENRTLVIGERGASGSDGAISIYDDSSGAWTRQQRITQAGDLGIGLALSVSGDWIAAGAPYDGNWRGGVYLYHFDGSSWSLHSTLTADDLTTWDFFGGDVAIENNTLVVGAASHPQDDEPQSGAAYVYQFDGSQWQFAQKLLSPIPVNRSRFGQSVAIDDGTIMIGQNGLVHVFRAVPEPSSAFLAAFAVLAISAGHRPRSWNRN